MTGPTRPYLLAKRGFDLVAASASILLLGPAMLVIALAIRTSSGSPILYRGTRIGLGGRPFRILKFRTMQVGAEAAGTTTRLGDPRITRVGQFLRRYKLDELPQLFNVIRGEMSIVGPRPEVEEHTREYDEEERCILTVLPGITDYASIELVNLDEILGAGDAHRTFVEHVRARKNGLRVKYVRQQSFLVDVRIIARTLLAIVGKARRTRREPANA